jgi:hypothetical protein
LFTFCEPTRTPTTQIFLPGREGVRGWVHWHSLVIDFKRWKGVHHHWSYDQYGEIESRRIAGMRDVVAHHYFSIYDDIVWDIVINKIPILEIQIQEILEVRNS